MVALQTMRRTCTTTYIIERPGEDGPVELSCGLAEHGGGLHCDMWLGLWWLAAGG